MTNQGFIDRLNNAKCNLETLVPASLLQLSLACLYSGINWGALKDDGLNATFADGKFSSIKYLEKFPENQRRAAAIAVIDASIAALESQV